MSWAAYDAAVEAAAIQERGLREELREARAEVERLRASDYYWAQRAEQAEARLAQLESEASHATALYKDLREAGARLRHHVQGLIGKVRGPAREQILRDLKHWVALAAVQPEEQKPE